MIHHSKLTDEIGMKGTLFAFAAILACSLVLVKVMRVRPRIIDIFYYSTASGDECPSGSFSSESGNHAKAHPTPTYGYLFKKSKLEVGNCLFAGMVTTAWIEQATPSLGN